MGDGRSIFLWHDLWHPNGVLFQKYGHRVIYDPASQFEAKVATVLEEKQWVWKAARSEQPVDIQSKLSLIKLKDPNRALWASYKFNCANTWDELRMKGQMVPWWKLI